MPSSKVLIVAICSHRKHPGGQPVYGSEQALGSMVPDIRSELFEKRKDALKALKGAKRSGIPVKDYELNAKIEGEARDFGGRMDAPWLPAIQRYEGASMWPWQQTLTNAWRWCAIVRTIC